jgi:electron transfer flavoprotein beta subunit
VKVAVCIKQVPAKDGPFALDKSALWIQERDIGFEVNEADAYALEEGVKIVEQQGGELLLLSLGPDRVCSVLKDGLAKGAHRAIHVSMEDCNALLPHTLADIIGGVLQDECPDLVLVGMQSDDRCNGQLAANLARALKVAHATLVAEVVWTENELRVTRELDGGRYEEIAISLPCVLGIQSGINRPRYASMKGMMAAKKKKIERRTLEEPSPGNDAGGVSLRRIYVPAKNKSGKVVDGNDSAAVADVVAVLNEVVATRLL